MTAETTTPVPDEPGTSTPDATASQTPPPASEQGGPRRRRWPWLAAVLLLVGAFASGGALARATVVYADSLDGRLLPGTQVAGVEVGGMTHDEALVEVRRSLRRELNRTMVVRWRDRRWKTRARELGASTNARQAIADVAAAQSGMDWQDWARLRWLGEQADDTAEVAVTYNRAASVSFIEGIAGSIEAEPRDASMKVDNGDVVIFEEKRGRQVVRASAVDALHRSLRNRNRPVDLEVKPLKADVTAAAFHQVLHLDQSEHRLTLHVDGEPTHSWIVATGTGDYPTPLGRYSVTEKRYLPTWINPSPDDWGADMPAEIGPGPNNPLGLRAINWSAPAIRFHGTQAVDSLGTDASHGCVRMSNKDVIELYDLIDVGAVIESQP